LLWPVTWDQTAPAIALAIAIRFWGDAQFRGQIAGVVFAQILIAIQLTDVLQLARLVPEQGQERSLTC
jgi:hypothetical protein